MILCRTNPGRTLALLLLLPALVHNFPATAQIEPAAKRPAAVEPKRLPIAFRDRLLPAPVNGGFRDTNYWIWCGSVTRGRDGRYHLFASRWPHALAFSPHWLSNSEIVHAVSDTPEGPFTFSDVALPPRGDEFWDGKMTHNPVVVFHNGRYHIFYTGTTYHGPMPTPETQITEASAMKLEAHRGERVGMASADSPYGPWTRRDRPILDVRPGTWERYLLSNPAPLPLADGSVLLYYKGVEELRKHAIGIARAASIEGPYVRLSDSPFPAGVGAEDPTMWFENGRYHALMLDHNRLFSDKGIYHATSTNGLNWETAPNPVAVTRDYAWGDGVRRRMHSTERPQILVQNGVATHLFLATGADVNSSRQTWNQVIPLKPESAVPDRLAWWREARFGLFIHWGLYSIPGGVWNGQPVHDARYANPYCEHLMWLNRIPLADYRKLADQFNPTNWDARAIVGMAKAAGMKYVVFTAKHHDGFAMYQSKTDRWNTAAATPWKRDPLRDLADACRDAGLKLGIYYSLGRDWSHPHAIAKDRENVWDFPAEGRDSRQYLEEKVFPQLTELLTGYGPVAVVWFDTPEQTTRKQSIALELLVRRYQPDAIVNTRVGNDVGDYLELEDNQIPEKPTGGDFEVPATMAASWGYSQLDTEPYWKSSRQLIRHLIDIASKGGNYLLNIGPDGSGAVPVLARERLADIARWMERHGEAIHGTLACSLPQPDWGRFTQRGNTLYAHIFDWPANGTLRLPVAPEFIGKLEWVGGKTPQPVAFTPAPNGAVLVNLPAAAPDPSVSVLRVTLK
jgi:alpha-L-fucosidase